MSKTAAQQTRRFSRIIKPLKAFFRGRGDVSLVFLFGSVVSNQITPRSDIDIGILFKEIPDIYELNDMKEDLSALLKKDVDIVLLNDASPILRMQVLKNGIIIIQKDKNDFSMFYGDTVKQYDDLKIIRKKCEDNILRGRIYA